MAETERSGELRETTYQRRRSERRKRLDDLHRRYLAARRPDQRDAIWQAILRVDAEGPYGR